MKENQRIVSPDLYDKDYYLEGNDGFKEFMEGLEKKMHDKFKRVFVHCEIKPKDYVLDLGCGRGETLFYSAKKGAHALGLDYSPAAIELCKRSIEQLPEELRENVRAEVSTVEDYEFREKYDFIFMVEVAEHMYDWQLEATFKKVSQILKKRGKFIITTPNYLYEAYFQPVKMFLYLPFRFLKYLFRIPRGKFKPKSLKEFFAIACKIRINRGGNHEKQHCNVMTRKRLRNLLKDFDAHIFCEDHSLFPLSLLLRKWFGRQIVAVATLKERYDIKMHT